MFGTAGAPPKPLAAAELRGFARHVTLQIGWLATGKSKALQEAKTLKVQRAPIDFARCRFAFKLIAYTG